MLKFIKIILLYWAFVFSVLANSQDINYVNILAKNVVTQNNITTATDKVVIFSPSYYMTSKKAIYNMNKKTIELIGDVNIVKNNLEHTMSDYAFIDLNKEEFFQKPIFMINYTDSLWVSSDSIKSDSNETKLECSIMSSCDADDPFWNIKFEKGIQNKQSKWVHTFDTKLYIKSVPVFYTPYFGFPTDKSRRTGLLRPTLGYSNEEGFLYAQPIYIAPKSNWDLELVPQYRGSRGYGLYSYYRLADSPYSKALFKLGGFKEQNDYTFTKQLKNDNHFGWDFDYSRSKLFSSNDTQDGLYTSFHFLNDIDYKNLEQVNKTEDYAKNIESKLNYFYKTNDYYSGLYARYYLDSSKQNNDSTLQQYPVVQLHSFSDSLFIKELFYMSDFKYENYTRKTGINARVYNLNIPISYSLSLFDDYVRLTLKEIIETTKIEYTNKDTYFKNGTIFQTKQAISIATDLLKEYSGYLHTMNINLTYTVPNKSDVKGDIYNVNTQATEISPFSQTISKDKELALTFNQSVFSKNTISEIINHKLKQIMVFQDNQKSNLQNLENELLFYYSLGSISNRMVYNHDDKRIIEYSSTFNFKKNGSFVNVNHYGTNKTVHSNKADSQSLVFSGGYNFNRFYTISYKNTYDILNNISNKQEYIFDMDKKCWGLSLKFEDSLVASSAINAEPLRQKIIYLLLELKPIGGFKQKYNIDNTK